MKKESNLKRLLDYAGGYKYLTIASWILSAISCDFDLCCGTDLFTSGGFPCTGKCSYESNAPHRDTAYGVHGQYGQRQGQKDCL